MQEFMNGFVGFMNMLNIGINIESMIVLVIIAIWLWIILWVAKDISARSDSFILQVLSILLIVVLTPLIGLAVYILIRPVTYRYQRQILDMLSVDTISCKNCGMINEDDYKYCVSCGEALLIKCKECKTEYNNEFNYCPECGAPNAETLEDK